METEIGSTLIDRGNVEALIIKDKHHLVIIFCGLDHIHILPVFTRDFNTIAETKYNSLQLEQTEFQIWDYFEKNLMYTEAKN